MPNPFDLDALEKRNKRRESDRFSSDFTIAEVSSLTARVRQAEREVKAWEIAFEQERNYLIGGSEDFSIIQSLNRLRERQHQLSGETNA